MAKTYTQHISNGVQTVYPVTFSLGIGKKSFVYVYTGSLQDIDEPLEQVPFVWNSPTEIALVSPLPDTTEFTIRRRVPRDRLVNDYVDGATLRDENLNDSLSQPLMIAEENEDGFASDLATVPFLVSVDMNGNKILQLADGEDPGDAVNKGQLDAAITPIIRSITAATPNVTVTVDPSGNATLGAVALGGGDVFLAANNTFEDANVFQGAVEFNVAPTIGGVTLAGQRVNARWDTGLWGDLNDIDVTGLYASNSVITYNLPDTEHTVAYTLHQQSGIRAYQQCTTINYVGNQVRQFVRTKNSGVWGEWYTSDKVLTTTPVTLKVGTGGFGSIAEAIEYALSKYDLRDNAQVLLELQSGFILQEQVITSGRDLSMFTIISVDPIVDVDDAYIVAAPFNASTPVFGAGNGGKLPYIAAHFKFPIVTTNLHRVGVLALGAGSAANVAPGAGVSQSYTGVYAIQGGTIHAEAAIFENCYKYAARARYGATLNVESALIRGAGDTNLLVDECSVVSAKGADCTNSAYHGVRVYGASTVDLEDAIITDCTTQAVYVGGASRVNMIGAHISATVSGIVCEGMSAVLAAHVVGTLITGTGITVNTGGQVSAIETTVTLSKTANAITAAGIIFK